MSVIWCNHLGCIRRFYLCRKGYLRLNFKIYFKFGYRDSNYPFYGSLVAEDEFKLLKTQENIKQCVLLGFYKEPRNTILILERGQIYKGSQKTALTYDQINDPYYQSSYSPLSGIITQGTSNNASQKNYFSELGVDDKAWDLNFRF